MKEFLKNAREMADKNYRENLTYVDSYLKSGVNEAASKGLHEATVKLQGYSSGVHLVRRCEELGLKATFTMNGSWAICNVIF